MEAEEYQRGRKSSRGGGEQGRGSERPDLQEDGVVSQSGGQILQGR